MSYQNQVTASIPTITQEMKEVFNDSDNEFNQLIEDFFGIGTASTCVNPSPSNNNDNNNSSISSNLTTTANPQCSIAAPSGNGAIITAVDQTAISPAGVPDSGQDTASFNSEQVDDSPSFLVIESEKSRGATYFVHEQKRLVTAKRGSFIVIAVNGAKAGDQVHVSTRYTEIDSCDEPVLCRSTNPKCHPKHNGNKRCPNPPPDAFDFCAKADQNYHVDYSNVKEVDSPTSSLNSVMHPTAVIHYNGSSAASNLTFCIAFHCLNSCESHKPNGSGKNLLLRLVDGTNNTVICEKTYDLRVCVSAKRDHEERINGSASSLKRKRDVEDYDAPVVTFINDEEMPPLEPDSKKGVKQILLTAQSPPKFVKQEIPEVTSSHQTTIFENQLPAGGSSKQLSVTYSQPMVDSKPPCLQVQMKSIDDTNLVKDLVERLGGKVRLISQ